MMLKTGVWHKQGEGVATLPRQVFVRHLNGARTDDNLRHGICGSNIESIASHGRISMIDRIDTPRRSALMPFPTAAARTLRVVPLLALLCLFAIGGHAQADGNILINGDLTKGSGNQPDHWHTDAWKNEASFTTYHWNHEGSVKKGSSKSRVEA